MGSRLSYAGNQKDLEIIELCQQLILSCIPGFKIIHFSDQKEKIYFFEGLTN